MTSKIERIKKAKREARRRKTSSEAGIIAGRNQRARTIRYINEGFAKHERYLKTGQGRLNDDEYRKIVHLMYGRHQWRYSGIPTCSALFLSHDLVAHLLAEARDQLRLALLEVVAALYSKEVFDDPKTWPRARRLDGIALALVSGDAAPPMGAEEWASLNRLAAYRVAVLGAYPQARPLSCRSRSAEKRTT